MYELRRLLLAIGATRHSSCRPIHKAWAHTSSPSISSSRPDVGPTSFTLRCYAGSQILRQEGVNCAIPTPNGNKTFSVDPDNNTLVESIKDVTIDDIGGNLHQRKYAVAAPAALLPAVTVASRHFAAKPSRTSGHRRSTGHRDVVHVSAPLARHSSTRATCQLSQVISELHQSAIHNAFMTYEFWHQALCHAAPASITKTGKLIQESNIIPDCPQDFHCEACSLAKSHHNKPQPSLSRAKERGEYIHSDLCGPFPTPSIENALYYISFVDDATRYPNVQFLKHKSDATPTIIAFFTELETQYRCKTKAFRSDNGGEYVNNDLRKFFAQKGIVHDLTFPYSPESNGFAERLYRSIAEAIL
ncbi:hypothetical protein K3495_g1071 [Podosphaera aphanis]|nr:hypothetical protein K3495_g1071 [Podosphaera aphanis]